MQVFFFLILILKCDFRLSPYEIIYEPHDLAPLDRFFKKVPVVQVQTTGTL